VYPYHTSRAIDEQLAGSLKPKRKIENIYEDMMDVWFSQGPSINFAKKRIRGPHNRALKKQKARSKVNATDKE